MIEELGKKISSVFTLEALYRLQTSSLYIYNDNKGDLTPNLFGSVQSDCGWFGLFGLM